MKAQLMKNRLLAQAVLLLLATSSAIAQLPADAVMLDRVKIPEKQKSVDLCPVFLVPSDPKLPIWTYKGVAYRGSKPGAQEQFAKEPEKYAKAAEKQRYVNNFMQAMSTVWCPVTDEITPGGMTQWKRLGFTFESCCAFCDENFEEEQFAEALKRLRTRAEKTYGLVGAKYTEGAKSPVEGTPSRRPIPRQNQSKPFGEISLLHCVTLVSIHVCASGRDAVQGSSTTSLPARVAIARQTAMSIESVTNRALLSHSNMATPPG